VERKAGMNEGKGQRSKGGKKNSERAFFRIEPAVKTTGRDGVEKAEGERTPHRRKKEAQ